MHTTTDAEPFRSAPLVDLLKEAGVRKDSLIRITGPNALAALLWLCRHGYDQVGYVRPGEGCPHEEPDAFLVAHTCDELDLKRLLSVARQTRPGGVFIFQVRCSGQSTPLAVQWLLDHGGFIVERRIERGRRQLLVARRRGAAWQEAA